MINGRKPHFLEVFLPNLSSQRLEIPSKFIKHLKGRTTGALSLTGPSGNSWHVELADHNGHLFFDCGWPIFVEDHSIQCGDSLVFRYDGNSRFTVQIFDQSSCEKDEAFSAKCSQESMNSNRNLEKKRGRGEEEFLYDEVDERKHTLFPVCRESPDGYKKKGLIFCTVVCDSSTREFNEFQKPIVIGLPCESNTEWKAAILKKASGGKKLAKKEQNTPINISISKFIESRAAEYITSSSYFVRVMNYSNISGNGTMKVPIKFAEVHLPNYRTKVTLRNLNGDCWMVNCLATARKSSTMHTFCGGWLAFVRANGLKIEDVCIFELVGELEMLVRILRLGVEGLQNQTENNSIDASSIEISGMPLQSDVDLPQNTTTDQFLRHSKRLNDLHMYNYEEHEDNLGTIPAIKQEVTAFFCTSDDTTIPNSPIWSALSPLSRTSDECKDKFLMCSTGEALLNETSQGSEVDFKASDIIDKWATNEETIAALAFDSPFPYFMKVIKSSNIGEKGTLGIPRKFSAHLPSHKTDIVLRNLEGDSWSVVSARYGPQTKLYGGWKSFARKNGVKVGDVCVFELVGEKVLQVRVCAGGHNQQGSQSSKCRISS